MSSERTISGVLFDKDGTLVDYDATWRPTNWRAARRLARGDEAIARQLLTVGGHDPSSDQIAPHTPLSAGTSLEIATLWAPLLGRSDVGAMAREIDAAFMAGALENLTPVAGLAETLQALHAAGTVLGVATSDSEAAAHKNLEQLGITGLFSFVCGYDSGHGAKPQPGMIRAFCASCGLDAGAVAMVGDSHHDLEMGRAAGVGLNIGVLTGPAPRSDLESLADEVLADLRGVPGLIGIG